MEKKKLPATPAKAQPPAFYEDARVQAFAVVLAALGSSLFKWSDEIAPHVQTLLIAVAGGVIGLILMAYGVIKAKLRNALQRETQKALAQAATQPETVKEVRVRDPHTDQVYMVNLDDVMKE